MTQINLRHGIFLPPFHPNEENPTACLERDLDLIVWLDRLGFHEAWIGEHHSAGYEIISSPEIFIAFAAERTRHIRLGTGVVSLPYHHPMMIADRIVQLDHMTRGRVMFGAGPGLLASDAIMMGIDPMTQRDRMAEALDAILRLFRGEIVTEKTDWYTMDGARLHLLPYTKPYPEVAVVSAVTPSGGRLAGKYDLSMICVAATNPFGYDALAAQLADRLRCRRRARPRRWTRTGCASSARCTSPRPARRPSQNARWGFERYLGYLNNNQPRFIVPAGEDPLEWFVENRYGVCGTPDDAIALIERLQDKQGEFGVFLQQAHNWADLEATKRSYELYARYVMPHFSRDNRPRAASYQWCGDNRDEFSAKRQAAAKAMFDKHEAEQRAARREPPAARPRSVVTGQGFTRVQKSLCVRSCLSRIVHRTAEMGGLPSFAGAHANAESGNSDQDEDGYMTPPRSGAEVNLATHKFLLHIVDAGQQPPGQPRIVLRRVRMNGSEGTGIVYPPWGCAGEVHTLDRDRPDQHQNIRFLRCLRFEILGSFFLNPSTGSGIPGCRSRKSAWKSNCQ